MFKSNRNLFSSLNWWYLFPMHRFEFCMMRSFAFIMENIMSACYSDTPVWTPKLNNVWKTRYLNVAARIYSQSRKIVTIQRRTLGKNKIYRNWIKNIYFEVNTLWHIITNFRPHQSFYHCMAVILICCKITVTEVRKDMLSDIFGYVVINTWSICSLLNYIGRDLSLHSTDVLAV